MGSSMSDGQSDDAPALTQNLVRHVKPECGVVADPSPSDFGTAPAERLGEAYLDRDISHFYESLLVRA